MPDNFQLKYDINDLHAIVDALSEALDLRVGMCYADHAGGEHMRGTHPLSDVQQVVEIMGDVYTRTFMVLQDQDDINEEFLDRTRLGPVFWDLFYEVQGAKSWDDIPVHEEHEDCAVCTVVYG